MLVKDIWRKCSKKRKHSFIICKYERNLEKLKVVIQNHSMVILAKPYGVTPKSLLRGFTRPSELAIAIIRALLDFVREMHDAGCSLDGKFSVENLYWLSCKKQLQQVEEHSEMIYRIALTYIKERISWRQDVTNNSALVSVLTYKGGIAFTGCRENARLQGFPDYYRMFGPIKERNNAMGIEDWTCT